MHLLAPWWWLLFPPLAGILILLYLLKMRRRDYVVPSVFLWERALHDLQANAPLQKLRTHLLLLLQLLALLLVIFALSRPTLQSLNTGGQNIILIIDHSASMQSTDVSPTRFEAAKNIAKGAVDRLGPRDNMMLIAVGGTTQVLSSFTNDRRALRAALDRVQVDDTQADFHNALNIIAGLLHQKQQRSHLSIEIISDGAIPPLTLPREVNLPIHFTPVGQRCENVGIVVMDVRWQPREGKYEGLIVLKNFGAKAQTCTLEQSLDGKLQNAHEVTVPAGKDYTEVVRGLPAGGGVLRASIDLHDDLAVDNAVNAMLPRMEAIPVTLVSDDNIFLKTALSLDSSIHLTEQSAVPEHIAAGTVLVLNKKSTLPLPANVPALVIGKDALGACPNPPGTLRNEPDATSVVDWDRRHAILAHVDLADLHIAHAATVNPKNNAHVLIESAAGPVALTDETAGRRLLYLGWDVRNSDFPLRASFPIFISNTVNWLSGMQEKAQAMNAHTGQVVRMPVPSTTREVTVTEPGGQTRKVAASSGQVVLDQVTRTGIYRLTGAQFDQQIAINLLNADESNTLPQQTLPLVGSKGENVATAKQPVRTEGEWWRILLLLVFLLLAAEWFVFHRRIG